MGTLFNHLTREEIKEKQPDGSIISKRVFEKERSVRLHWIKYHVDECKKNNVLVFSKQERCLKQKLWEKTDEKETEGCFTSGSLKPQGSVTILGYRASKLLLPKCGKMSTANIEQVF